MDRSGLRSRAGWKELTELMNWLSSYFLDEAMPIQTSSVKRSALLRWRDEFVERSGIGVEITKGEAWSDVPILWFKYCSLLWRMSDLCDKAEEMCQFYNRSGPPSSLVNTRKHRSREINRETLLQTSPQKKEKNQRIPFTVTSHPQNLIVESSYETLLARVKHFQYHHCRDLMNTLIHVSDGLKQFQCKQFWQ